MLGKAGVIVKPVLVLLVIVALLMLLMWAFQRKLIYFPDTEDPGAAHLAIAGARDVTLSTEDGLELKAWFVPATANDRGIRVLVAHGNGGNRAARAPLAEALAAQGFSVLLLDYRGYGANPGSPTEQGLLLDAKAALTFLGPGPVVYCGESLGTGVVTALALEHPPAALILRSPFTSLPDAGAVHYPFLPVRLLARDKFPVADHVARLGVPTVVVYGSDDSIVPAAQSREVAKRAAGPVTVVEVKGADHNDRVLLDGPELIAAVVSALPAPNR